jgi:hypothetical protein
VVFYLRFFNANGDSSVGRRSKEKKRQHQAHGCLLVKLHGARYSVAQLTRLKRQAIAGCDKDKSFTRSKHAVCLGRTTNEVVEFTIHEAEGDRVGYMYIRSM